MFWAGNSIIQEASSSIFCFSPTWGTQSSASPTFALRPQVQKAETTISQGPGKLQQLSPAPGAGGLPVPSHSWHQELRLTQTLLLQWLFGHVRTSIMLAELSPTAAPGKLCFLADQSDTWMYSGMRDHGSLRGTNN